jgi:Mg-chelatase subunit ChlD
MTPEQKAALLRWRLVLGRAAEYKGCKLCLAGLDGGSVKMLDDTLSYIYDSGSKGASLDDSAPYVPASLSQWLSRVREFFSSDVVALVQKDAIDRKNLHALLFEPETLPLLEKNVDLVSTLVAVKDMIPSRSKDLARQFVREVVDKIKRRLEDNLRQTVLGALRRSEHSPLAVFRNIDWKRTISRSLKNYDRERRVVVPDRFHFWANQRKQREWHVIVLVDQSGSMGESVVYSSIMAAIMASLDVLKTHLVFFDTAVVDMSEHLSDPVDVIFGARLGGGTDIAKAVRYGQTLVERPDRTIFLLITDLYEGGNAGRMLRTISELVESRVKVLTLLALTDDGKASFDAQMAEKVAALGAHVFGCTPEKLILAMERILKGRDLSDLVKSGG